MSRFLNELKDKAQSAINATPLAQYVPGREGSQSSGGGGGRSHAFGAIQHQIRSLQVQYGSGGGKDVRQLQLIITGQKGVILDLERQAGDGQAVSKELYLWGQSEDSDIKDVTDRLAYLTFVQGSLAQSLASSLDAARAPLKALRDAEAQLQPKRNIRHGIELQISRLRNEAKPGTEAKIRELETSLDKVVKEDEPHEREVELLKRKALIDSEKMKWDAMKEYGEKLVLLANASKPLIESLPHVPPTAQHPYTGAASTASTRALLQKALDNYKPGTTTLPVPTSADNETRSFGETHASELSRISSVADRRTPPIRYDSTPSPVGASVHPSVTTIHHDSAVSGVSGISGISQASVASTGSTVDPNALNNSPAPIPKKESPETILPSITLPEPQSAISTGTVTVPATHPTVAETGVPIIAGEDGPGPSHGSLASPARGPGYGEATPAYGNADGPKYGLSEGGSVVVVPAHESAEEEKRRLEREEREKVLRGERPGYGSGAQAGPSGSGSSSIYETAEEEKDRLAREDRERVLAGQATAATQYPRQHSVDDTDNQGEVNAPPPYEEPR